MFGNWAREKKNRCSSTETLPSNPANCCFSPPRSVLQDFENLLPHKSTLHAVCNVYFCVILILFLCIAGCTYTYYYYYWERAACAGCSVAAGCFLGGYYIVRRCSLQLLSLALLPFRCTFKKKKFIIQIRISRYIYLKTRGGPVSADASTSSLVFARWKPPHIYYTYVIVHRVCEDSQCREE